MWDRRAEYVRNYDGDTVTMNLDKGEDWIHENYPVRLMGVFCPEMHESGGPECQEFVESWFRQRLRANIRWNFIVITARTPRSDKAQTTLSRYVGTVTSLDGTDNLNTAIIDFVQRKGYSRGIGG